MELTNDKLIEESKQNANKARLGMIFKRGRWVWPESIPENVRRKYRPSYNNSYGEVKKTNGSLNRKYCDCGSMATIKKNNANICVRCDEIEKKMGHMILNH